MKKVRPSERKRKLFEEALHVEGETILEVWHRHCRETMIQAAIARAFSKTDRQRCLAHKLRNIHAKLPKAIADYILSEVKAVYYAPDRKTADVLASQFIERYSREYPTAMKCFSDDQQHRPVGLDACLTQLKYPLGHRRFIRTTNLLERAYEEEKRRTKVFPQHQHECSMLGLVFSVLYRASLRWHRVSMSVLELTQLKLIRSLICPGDHENSRISYRMAA